MCFNDKTYCSRSNRLHCQVNKVEPCNNIFCHRHIWEIPVTNNIPVCYSDFSENCKTYFNEVESAECPFCGSYDTKITYRIKGKYFQKSNGNELVDYVFRASCNVCKSQTGAIRMNNIEKNNEHSIKLGKLATIWKWNGYGKRKVNKEHRANEIEKLQEKKAQLKEAMKILKTYGFTRNDKGV